MGGAAVLEEKYAKQIALIIDSAEPGMIISLNMEDAIKTAEKEGVTPNNIIIIRDNVVTVKLREKEGDPLSSYSFFNDVSVNAYIGQDNKNYFFVINKK